MKMYTQYGFVFNLNLHCWQVFDKIDSSEYVLQFLLRLDLFQMKNMTLKKTHIWCEK